MENTEFSVILNMLNEISHKFDTLEHKVDTKIDALENKFNTKINALENKFDSKFDALENKVNNNSTNIITIINTISRIQKDITGLRDDIETVYSL